MGWYEIAGNIATFLAAILVVGTALVFNLFLRAKKDPEPNVPSAACAYLMVIAYLIIWSLVSSSMSNGSWDSSPIDQIVGALFLVAMIVHFLIAVEFGANLLKASISAMKEELE